MKHSKIILILVFLNIIAVKTILGQGIKFPVNDTVKYIIKNEPLRFFGGTFWTGIEIPIQNKNSVYFAGIVTYGSPVNNNKHLAGWGAEVQYRNYLGKGTFSTNFPIYLAPQLMYRRTEEYTLLQVYQTIYNEYGGYIDYNNPTFIETKKFSNVFYGGLLLGGQIFINHMFTVDVNFGGGLRLVQIDGESGFSKYKSITSLDYSGVVPRASIIIGIIRN
ncbi:MAG: hypothetical protein H0V01_15770 [Bacteroidetes bacterium]|nr:hypothetical protein [Bacteroidota bacterium]HET6244234.1 hypothetical protein [Bacteroidia bacterium]